VICQLQVIEKVNRASFTSWFVADEAATTSAQVRDRSGSVTPPRSRAENDLQDPSTTNNSPSSTSSLYEDASESMADDEQPSESGSEPYFLTACFSGDYDHAASVDTITGEPLIKYSVTRGARTAQCLLFFVSSVVFVNKNIGAEAILMWKYEQKPR